MFNDRKWNSKVSFLNTTQKIIGNTFPWWWIPAWIACCSRNCVDCIRSSPEGRAVVAGAGCSSGFHPLPGPSTPSIMAQFRSPCGKLTLRQPHVDPLNSRYSTTRYRIASFSPPPSVGRFSPNWTSDWSTQCLLGRSYARRRYAMLAGASVTPRLPSGVLPRLFPLPFASHPNATRSTRGTRSSRLGHLVLRLSRASRVPARGELTLPRYPPRVHPRARCCQEDRSVRGENGVWKWERSTNAGKRRLDRVVRDSSNRDSASMDNQSFFFFRVI